MIHKLPFPSFSTPQLLRLSGLSRRTLQRAEDAGAVSPRGGRGGRGVKGTWAFMSVLGCAYAKQFIDGNFTHATAYAACRWVARQDPLALAEALDDGRTFLFVVPSGEAELINLYVPPNASRRYVRMGRQLDLRACVLRVLREAKAQYARWGQAERLLAERLRGEVTGGR
jgi:hypothetical protein